MSRPLILTSLLLVSGAAFAGSHDELPYARCFGTLKDVEPGMDLEVDLGATVLSPTALSGFFYEGILRRQDPKIGESSYERDRTIERKTLGADEDYRPRKEEYRNMNRFTVPGGGVGMSLLLPKNLGDEFTAKGYLQLNSAGQHGTIELECEVAAH